MRYSCKLSIFFFTDFVNRNYFEAWKMRNATHQTTFKEALKFRGTNPKTGDIYVVSFFKDHLTTEISEGDSYEFEKLSLREVT